MFPIARHSVNLSFNIIFSALFKKVKVPKKINYREAFENKFSKYIGSKYGLGVSSARQGLSAILKTLPLRPADQIIISAYNFHPIPLIVKLAGYEPLFVDIQENTPNIDLNKIEEKITSKTKVLLISHLLGYPANMEKAVNLAKKYNLYLIEDCAHSLGAEYNGKKTGIWADAAIFSFGYGKIIPCFGGGMITVNDENFYKKLKKNIKEVKKTVFKDLVKTLIIYILSHRYVFGWLVYPFMKMFFPVIDKKFEKSKKIKFEGSVGDCKAIAPLQAKLGLLQMDNLPTYLSKNRKNSCLLNDLLKKQLPEVILKEKKYSNPAYLYYMIKVEDKDSFRKYLLKHGVDTKKSYLSLPGELKPLIKDNGKYRNATILRQKAVEIPHGIFLLPEDMKYIASQIIAYYKKYESKI